MILSVQGLEFSYPSNKVLKDVSFSIKKGECLAILGTNGTGKSTLLKCINRILKPQKGAVLIDKSDVQKLNQTDLAKRIGYVSQSNQSFRTTVFDTVLIGRKPYIKWDVTEKDLNIVNRAIEMLGLQEYSLRYIDELSGGELQKVIIARALAQEPKILMFDEPTSSLDLKNQLEVISIIKDVVKNKKISALVTIHDLNLALRFADKFILLKESKIYAAGGIEIMTSHNIESVYSVPVKVENLSSRMVVVPI
ncbi:ABC transporter ATP-binding protein [Vallitalea guaymasensis]|uniref:ABC transporter ATP-binding protein n=1 Tax=Vallitalea guaymasensis TaxID=1185412 RepID=A0A8J8SCN9_9FIRM|nr:ABC transporter ATP-binding protein [Vallitalea guaymasensis]QUH29874.1 ABC transporter ATP-binding protein [Vallitalea guaymasensis]